MHSALRVGSLGDNPKAADEAVWALARSFPHLSAHVRVTCGQIVVFAVFGVGLVIGSIIAPRGMALAIAAMMAAGFVANVVFRSLLIWIGAGDVAAPLPARRWADEALPVYTVLVPLYHEAHIVPQLVEGLRALDYPLAKLDVKIVVEADDLETVAAAERSATGEGFSVVKVPACHPRTKPKACNFALPSARGEYLVIYDAEDRPERDQLRKAVSAFADASHSLGCLQARLSFYNATHCWLSADILAQRDKEKLAA